MDEKATNAILGKLDAIIKLMVFRMTEGKSQTEQIRLLSAVGFEPKEIAEAIETTPNTVRVTLFNLRRHKGKATGREKRQI
jgi:DNA-binding CsgD family transcriptional regulator